MNNPSLKNLNKDRNFKALYLDVSIEKWGQVWSHITGNLTRQDVKGTIHHKAPGKHISRRNYIDVTDLVGIPGPHDHRGSRGRRVRGLRAVHHIQESLSGAENLRCWWLVGEKSKVLGTCWWRWNGEGWSWVVKVCGLRWSEEYEPVEKELVTTSFAS